MCGFISAGRASHLYLRRSRVRIPLKLAKRTITKNRFVSVRSHETPRTESDKHCDQNKANVWAGAVVVILKAEILVNASVYRSRNKRNGRHQTLLLGWAQNRLKISRKMAGITKRVGEIGEENIPVEGFVRARSPLNQIIRQKKRTNGGLGFWLA